MKMKIGVYATIFAAIAMGNIAAAQDNKNESKPESTSDIMLAKVPVAEVIQRDIVPFSEFTGYLAAPKIVELRPRVGGRINSVSIPEGQIIQKGDLLFLIDPQPFQIALDNAIGQLSQAEASALRANSDYNRIKKLIDKGVVSRKDYDDAQANRTVSNAQVKSAKAAVDAAKLNLSYTQVKAPITGRVDRALITEGNLVTGGDINTATLLTTIVSIDPVYAYFDIDEKTFHKLSAIQAESGTDQGTERPSVNISVSEEKNYPYSGSLDFMSNQIDRTTGTVKARAVVKNKNGTLIPGSFIRVQLPVGIKTSSILIDDQAIGFNQGQSYVLVIDNSNKAVYRQVEPGAMIDGLRVIKSGLVKGERIIIKGLVRPGMEVMPENVPMYLPEAENNNIGQSSDSVLNEAEGNQ
ncbi:efflux RND transporter periplasmic adaptor subunit [Morganella psychrotolerans]|uniref:Efflux RND transporter periplasmic adaptor subunit n=2 Tax=Morganella psychrotolerans TaxID=368603 RepID=A0A5M9QWX6_9GAMM|nr:efflux RND transporter periplasmic adaptor subunit [Morganella psychrotolerans]KAA8713204.1 efflux RND transporter periplasmic adaptor subunit [Morganella psychrotolerans]